MTGIRLCTAATSGLGSEVAAFLLWEKEATSKNCACVARDRARPHCQPFANASRSVGCTFNRVMHSELKSFLSNAERKRQFAKDQMTKHLQIVIDLIIHGAGGR